MSINKAHSHAMKINIFLSAVFILAILCSGCGSKNNNASLDPNEPNEQTFKLLSLEEASEVVADIAVVATKMIESEEAQIIFTDQRPLNEAAKEICSESHFTQCRQSLENEMKTSVLLNFLGSIGSKVNNRAHKVKKIV